MSALGQLDVAVAQERLVELVSTLAEIPSQPHQNPHAHHFLASHFQSGGFRHEFPEPLGVLRNVSRPVYDEEVRNQVAHAKDTLGDGDLEKMLNSGDTWVVK